MRPTFITRTIRLVGDVQRQTAIAALTHAPIDPERPLEVLIREEKKTRKEDQNAAYWAGPLRDIAEQAWVDGQQYKADVWHEYFKEMFLPEDDDEELAILAKDGYRKWDFDPKGRRRLVGSTTQLTVKGMARYTKQIEAEGASLGVVFHVAPRRVA